MQVRRCLGLLPLHSIPLYRTLKMMGARIGEDTDSMTFHLPAFTDTDKNPDEIADDIATHFAAISQQFEPINLNKLLPNLYNFQTDTLSEAFIPLLIVLIIVHHK